MHSHTFRAIVAIALTVAIAMLSCNSFGQSSRRGMMAISDGEGEYVMSYAEPPIELIVRPFLTRQDLPLFVEYLSLSDAQAQAVERLIAKYLEDFAALLEKMHPQPEGKRFGMREIPADAKDPNANKEAEVKQPEGEPQLRRNADGDVNAEDVEEGAGGGPVDDVSAILLDEIRKEGINVNSLEDLPVEPMIGIGISISGPGEGEPADAAPEPNVDVSVGFGSEDDRLDEGLRAKLEAAAKRAVPRMADAIKKQQIAQLAQGEGLGRSGLPPAEELEKRYRDNESLRARVEEFMKAKEALLNSFYASVKKLLSEQQLQQFPALVRALTRVKTLPWGELDGESVDLIAVTKDQSLTDEQRTAMASVLNDYEMRLHDLLVRRNELLEKTDGEIDRALHDDQYDKALSAADRIARARVAVRDLNDQTIDALQATLDERTGKRVRSAALAEAYPRIWRETIGQKAFDKAIMLEDLDPEIQTLMLEQAATHAQLMSEVNNRLWQAVRREQGNRLKSELESTVARYKGEDSEPIENIMADIRTSIRNAFQERQDLDVRSMKNLYAMLPADAVEKLPPIPTHDVGTPVRAQHTDNGMRILVDEEDE